MAKKGKALDLAIDNVEEEQVEFEVQPAPTTIKAERYTVVYDNDGKVIKSFPV